MSDILNDIKFVTDLNDQNQVQQVQEKCSTMDQLKTLKHSSAVFSEET